MTSQRCLVVDFETGGLETNRASIISMAAAVYDTAERFGRPNPAPLVAGETLFSRYIRPDWPVQAQAAAVNGYHPDTWGEEDERGPVSPKEALDDFGMFIAHVAADKDTPIHWTGANPSFDVRFYQSDQKRLKAIRPEGLSYRLIDVQSMAMPLLIQGEIQSVKLDGAPDRPGLRQWAGIPSTSAHTAMGDVLATMFVLHKLLNRV